MRNNTFTIKDIYDISLNFREAIRKANKNRDFNRGDRMNYFPCGCCDDSCDLLSYYLASNFQIHTKQMTGVYRDHNPNNITNHNWLIVDNIIIDITADQFPSYINYINGIYIGPNCYFYDTLEDVKYITSCNIKDNLRLWKDYQIILNYISNRTSESEGDE